MVGARVLSPCSESLAGSQRCVRTCPGVVWGAFLRSRDDVKFSPFLRAYSSEFLELGAGVSLRKSIIYVALSHITHFRGELCGCLERCSVRWHGAFQACYADFFGCLTSRPGRLHSSGGPLFGGLVHGFSSKGRRKYH